MANYIEKVALVAGVVLPFFNVPLIIRLWQRKRAEDLSVAWAVGVWICIVLMTPQALRSTDVAFRAYGVVNVLFFTVVAFQIVWYRRKR